MWFGLIHVAVRRTYLERRQPVYHLVLRNIEGCSQKRYEPVLYLPVLMVLQGIDVDNDSRWALFPGYPTCSDTLVNWHMRVLVFPWHNMAWCLNSIPG